MKLTLKRIIRSSLFNIYEQLDIFAWICIKLLPDKIILLLLKKRPWKNIFAYFIEDSKFRNKYRRILYDFFRRRYFKKTRFSSCLSICLSGRFLLDLFGIDHKIYLGTKKIENGKFMNHAWIFDSEQLISAIPGYEVILKEL